MCVKPKLIKVLIQTAKAAAAVAYCGIFVALLGLLADPQLPHRTRQVMIGYLVGVFIALFLAGYELGKELMRGISIAERNTCALILVAFALCWPLTAIIITIHWLGEDN